jgi:DNA-directed RNA polymerase specialized sigma24 family protein
MTTFEALAVAHLRKWAFERLRCQNGKVRNPAAVGWTQRDNRTADAALVRVIDFERALSELSQEEAVALIARYRDRQPDAVTAISLGCSVRKVSYLVPEARRKLAASLDRRCIL